MFVTIIAPPIERLPETVCEYRARRNSRTDTVSIQSRWIRHTQFKTEAQCSLAELTEHLAHRGRTLETATQDDLRGIAMNVRIMNRLRDSGLYSSQLGPPRPRRRRQRQLEER